MTDTEQSLYTLMTDLSGARTSEANHAGDVIKHDVWRTAHDRGEAVPTSGPVERSNYHGGEVFTPSAGLHKNIFYFDFSSMYPNSMRDGNMSPDTILGVGDMALMRSDYSESEVQWSYIDPRPIKDLGEDEMYGDFTDGEYKMVVDGGSMKWRDDWENIQEHMVRIYFLPHSERTGLLSGRADQYIRWNKSYEGRMYKATKRVRNVSIGSDLSREQLVSHAEQAIEEFNKTHLPPFVEETFGVSGNETEHELEFESYARRLFVPDDGGGDGVKKTYAQHITMEDGEDCDDLVIKGFEAKRSDTSDVTTAVQSDVLQSILSEPPAEAREAVYKRIRTAVDTIRAGEMPLRSIGQRGGLSKPPEEYGTEDRRPQPIYRGALYSKQHIDGEQTFSKPMKFPVEAVTGEYPSQYSAPTAQDGDAVDYISLEDPSNLPAEIDVDYDTVVTETLKQPLQPILRTMGWEWTAVTEGHERTELADFLQA